MTAPTTSNRWHAVLNSNNKLITKVEVQNILAQGDIFVEIANLDLFQQSFVHKSYLEVNLEQEQVPSPGTLPLQKTCNERLEWLGDSQVQATVSSYLWDRYPGQDEGFLTKLRSKLVKTKNLAYLATKLGMVGHLIISHHVEFGCHGRTNQRILENTFEAFIGAMYMDFSQKKNPAYGYEIVRRFIINIIEKYVDLAEMVIKDDNYKDQLMWLFQKTYDGAYPIYQKEKQENDHFYIFVTDPSTNKVVGRGVARSKKKAEQLAAKDALHHYAPGEKFGDDDDGSD